jgi:pyrroloquinoline quinone (PQQ) biosynthesis protein C
MTVMMKSCKYHMKCLFHRLCANYGVDNLGLRTLSSSTLDALKQFYAERDARAEQFAKLKAQAEEQHAAAATNAGQLSIEAFTEDWNESQFWVRRSVCSRGISFH